MGLHGHFNQYHECEWLQLPDQTGDMMQGTTISNRSPISVITVMKYPGGFSFSEKAKYKQCLDSSNNEGSLCVGILKRKLLWSGREVARMVESPPPKKKEREYLDSPQSLREGLKDVKNGEKEHSMSTISKQTTSTFKIDAMLQKGKAPL